MRLCTVLAVLIFAGAVAAAQAPNEHRHDSARPKFRCRRSRNKFASWKARSITWDSRCRLAIIARSTTLFPIPMRRRQLRT